MKPWYTIRAAADSAEVMIYDQIGKDWFGEGISAEVMVRELADLKVSSIDVRINSVGGQVFEGLAIFNALERHPATVHTYIDGIAASISSVIALAGDMVTIAENAFLMVHNAWGVTVGNRHDMLEMATTLEKLDGSIANTYMRKTGAHAEQVREWMDAETWFTSGEAKEVGLVDDIGAKRDIKGGFDLSKFANVPTQVAARLGARAQEPEPVATSPDVLTLFAESMRVLERTRVA